MFSFSRLMASWSVFFDGKPENRAFTTVSQADETGANMCSGESNCSKIFGSTLPSSYRFLY